MERGGVGLAEKGVTPTGWILGYSFTEPFIILQIKPLAQKQEPQMEIRKRLTILVNRFTT